MDGLFPISESESRILHELGWNSGYGWQNEWDWWFLNNPLDSRDDEETKLALIRHIAHIREFRDEADKAVKLYLKDTRHDK